MPPQIKSDINRSGWEATDFPSVCENCLPENQYVRMLKEDYGAECKLCTRPFTIFSWPGTRAHGRKKRTNICSTCARLKNCCQSCTLDLSFGLPIAVRDAALKMVAPGPNSDINREYFAQNNHEAIEKGLVGSDEYDKTDEKARELLMRLAQSKPYFRKGRQVDDDGRPLPSNSTGSSTGRPVTGGSGGSGSGSGGSVAVGAGVGGAGPIRTRDSRAARASGAGPARPGGGPRKTPAATLPPPGPKDWMPPADESLMSLFVTGVEDDLPDYKIRDFFKTHGKIRSLVCSHVSHCAFVNYDTRQAAEKAAAACQGRAVIAGCPLRVRWGQPRPINGMTREQRIEMIRDGRSAFPELRRRQNGPGEKYVGGADGGNADRKEVGPAPTGLAAAAPPGGDDVQYASLAGN